MAMNYGRLSIRYARALLLSAKENKTADKVYSQMCILNQAFEQLPELKVAICSPTISNEEKYDLLLSSISDKNDKETTGFLKFVIEQKRIDYLPSIVQMYEVLYRKDCNIVISDIKSATELSKEAVDSIKKYISKLSGSKNIEIRSSVDENLIGGFILDIDGNRLDASIKGQLNKLEYYAGH